MSGCAATIEQRKDFFRISRAFICFVIWGVDMIERSHGYFGRLLSQQPVDGGLIPREWFWFFRLGTKVGVFGNDAWMAQELLFSLGLERLVHR